jgi:hypothetical protein
MTFPLANFTTPYEWVAYASTVTGGWFWNLILVAIWVVAFGSLSGSTTTERAFATSSFFTGILASFLYVMGGIDALPTVIAIALAIVGFIMLLFVKGEK